MKNLIRKLIPDFLLTWYHFAWAFLGALIYRFPSKKIKVIGVTGTNGKSTVVFLIARVLKEAGYSVASLSSIRFQIKDQIWNNNLKMTMPGRMQIQQFINKAAKAGCDYVVLETTSEGIKQYRHRFINFNVAVFTNLTKEHLESHGGFSNYRAAKGRLFQLVEDGVSIINLDDDNTEYFLNFPARKKYGYCIKDQASSAKNHELRIVEAQGVKTEQNYSSFSVQDLSFKINLLGKFNIYNSLAAIAVGLAEGIPLEKIQLALEKVSGVPGRLEIVNKNPFRVVVDYAHTPDALEKVYQTLQVGLTGKMIGVLGSAGGARDHWKRPIMGRIADQYLDKIILTNEDPYDEDPNKIIDEIAEGIKRQQVKRIIDRRKAIGEVLKLAQPGDTVIITGKGCEPWMCVANGEKIPWNEKKVVKEELGNLLDAK